MHDAVLYFWCSPPNAIDLGAKGRFGIHPKNATNTKFKTSSHHVYVDGCCVFPTKSSINGTHGYHIIQ